MSLKQKVVFDAGVATPPDLFEINDQGGHLSRAPKSPYAITETINLVFTYHMGVVGALMGTTDKNLNIADGQRRPGAR